MEYPDSRTFTCEHCGQIILSDEYGRRVTYCIHYPYKPGLQAERLSHPPCRFHMKPHESMESLHVPE